MKSLESDIAVIGAGIVGVCCALSLQKSGYSVTLIDRDGVGEGASKGNAGHFATEQVLPLATPGLIWKIPGMLADPLGPVAIRWSYLHRITPWFIRFMLNTRQRPFQQGAVALSKLNSHSLPAWSRLLKRVRAEDQLKTDGSLLVFEKEQSFANYQATLNQLSEYGVKSALLSAGQVTELEPGLSSNIHHGVFFPETGHTADPYRLTRTLADFFVAQGGKIIQQPVSNMRTTDTGVALQIADQPFQVDKIVLATGAWSKSLTEQLTGKFVPLDTERGYHLMLPNAVNRLSIPVASADRRFIMTPMDEGLRLAGTVEFGGLNAKPNMKRAEMLAKHANALVPDLERETGDAWMGFRPSLPDSLPIIDRVGPRGQILLAFGHQHLGLTQAALTGELISSVLQGQNPIVDLKPFRLDRFS
jgi:glycine/D-amino acid oxidase-like deaminating enzyme